MEDLGTIKTKHIGKDVCLLNCQEFLLGPPLQMVLGKHKWNEWVKCCLYNMYVLFIEMIDSSKGKNKLTIKN